MAPDRTTDRDCADSRPTLPTHPALPAEWSAVLARAGATAPPEAIARAGDELLARWHQPHRRYHDVEHLTEVLAAIDLLAGHARRPELVRLAAWFHDAVYNGRPGQDEQDSASLAEQQLTRLGVESADAGQVGRLVRLTTTHRPGADDADGQVLCDADLAILAAPGPRYRRYRDAIRAEYRHLGEADFMAGRRAVLRALAERHPLYSTPTARQRWAAVAQQNLAAELAELAELAEREP